MKSSLVKPRAKAVQVSTTLKSVQGYVRAIHQSTSGQQETSVCHIFKQTSVCHMFEPKHLQNIAKTETLPLLSNVNLINVNLFALYLPTPEILTLLYEFQVCLGLKEFYSYTVHAWFLIPCHATGGENQALPPPEGEAGVHPAAGPGAAAVLRV